MQRNADKLTQYYTALSPKMDK